jgi:glutaredoxin-like protein NrdH
MDPQNQTPATVYGQPGCQPCKFVVKYLQSKGKIVTYHDVTEDANAMATITDLGYKGTPVIVMGFEHTQGFNPGWIDDRLDKVRTA